MLSRLATSVKRNCVKVRTGSIDSSRAQPGVKTDIEMLSR